jgi:putative DNA primase/helicase
LKSASESRARSLSPFWFVCRTFNRRLWIGSGDAKGKLSLLIGDPGLGKSTVLIDVACRISVGGQWPDGGYAPIGSVIILSAEDGLADTLRPRIERQGGDSSRIHALTAIRDKDSERPFNLAAGLSHLERAIREVGNVQLIIIDPISAYLGKTDAYKDAEVRTVLGPVATLLERYRVAVCGVAHLTKSDNAKALHRSLNSIAFVAAARTVFGVGVDGDAPERRILVAVKNNLARLPPALAFSIVSGGVLKWESGTVDGVEADTVLSAFATGGEESEERKDAVVFLQEILKDGEMACNDVLKAARGNGISDRTLKRAKSALHVASRKEGTGKGSRWFWSAPQKSANAPIDGPWHPSGKLRT